MSEVEAASKKEISALKAAAEAAQKNTSELDVGIGQANAEKETATKRIEELEGQLKEAESKAQISGESEDQSVSEDMNTAMKAELEALHAQRKADLTEVNAILEKLSPLVEGK